MADQSLRGALEMLDAQEGYLMLHEEGDEGNVHSSIRGISPQAGERLEPGSSAPALCFPVANAGAP